MTPARARELLPIIAAFANGEALQERTKEGLPFSEDRAWRDCGEDISWSAGDQEYRIKPKPRLRPWNSNEAPTFSMLRPKDEDEGKIVERVWHNDENGMLSCCQPRDGLESEKICLRTALKYYVRIDEHGNEHPCGVICGEGE